MQHLIRKQEKPVKIRICEYRRSKSFEDLCFGTIPINGSQKDSTLTGKEFDEISRKYSKFPERFELWCGLDLSDYKTSNFPGSAVKELERCHSAGARGIGEIHDKGKGLKSGNSLAPGMHPDDARMEAV